MLVFYIDFDGSGSVFSVSCKGFVEDPVIPDSLRLVGVEDLHDDNFPEFEIQEIVVRKSAIQHYAKGRIRPKLEVVEDPPLSMEANRPPPPPL